MDKIEKIAELLSLDKDACIELYSHIPELAEIARHRIIENPFGIDGLFVGSSGGKDSSVVCHLYATVCKKLNINPLIVHNRKDTVVDSTILNLYKNSLPVLYCSPSDIKYFSDRCKIQVDGSRRVEAVRDNGRSTDYVQDGKNVSRTNLEMYVPNSLFGLNFIYPIFDWSDEAVWMYNLYYKLRVSEEYGEVCYLYNT